MKKTFSKMTKKEKRMAILKDALKLIKQDMVIIDPNTVFQFDRRPSIHETIVGGLEPAEQLQKALVTHLKQGKKCTVCERGLLLVSTVLRDNDFKICDIEIGGTFDYESSTDRRLLRIFSAEQLRLMEDVLMISVDHIGWDEEEFGWDEEEFVDRRYDEKFYFFLTYPDATERAAAILENAIANDGIFKP